MHSTSKHYIKNHGISAKSGSFKSLLHKDGRSQYHSFLTDSSTHDPVHNQKSKFFSHISSTQPPRHDSSDGMCISYHDDEGKFHHKLDERRISEKVSNKQNLHTHLELPTKNKILVHNCISFRILT